MKLNKCNWSRTGVPFCAAALLVLAQGCCVTVNLSETSPTLQDAIQARTDVTAPPKALSLDLGSGVKMDLVLIRPGSFVMGSEAGESREHIRRVTITKPFYLGKYEVTQEQWQAVTGGNPSNFRASGNPVECISWNDCQDFVKKLSAKFPGAEFRLPTEAEWEYACRAASASEFYFGDNEANLGEYAWYAENSEQKTHLVGQRNPNAWGLYDMHGNVWEWCSDWYGDKYSDGDATNPLGAPSGAERVLRGGSWTVPPTMCRSAFRLKLDPTYRNFSNGLRVCRPASP